VKVKSEKVNDSLTSFLVFSFSLFHVLDLHTTVSPQAGREGVQHCQARRPARSNNIIQSFRVKGMECKSRRAFIFLF
jgi:hypothetical protein